MIEHRNAATTSTKDRTVSGHAIVFNKPTIINGAFIEQIAPGAVTETIKQDDIRCLYNHNADFVLARNTSGTLKLSEDTAGLRCEFEMADTGISQYIATAIERGDIFGWSFGFYVVEDNWIDTGFGAPERIVQKLILTEVSICGDPAYTGTDIAIRTESTFTAARHMAEANKRRRDLMLRELNRRLYPVH